MTNRNYNQLQHCIDDYLERQGKREIDEMEANSVLASEGLMDDDQSHPGRPLRELLALMRDSNLLPKNIRQSLGSWIIRNSRAFQMRQQIFSF